MIEEKGLYIYCISGSEDEASFGDIGIGGAEVRSLACNGFGVVVHECLAEPYNSKDDDGQAKEWVASHHNVVEASWQRFGTVIPMTFNVIVKGAQPLEELASWMEKEGERLRRLIGKLEGNQEFGVQVSWDKEKIAGKISRESTEIAKLKGDVASSTPGKAYFYNQQIQSVLKQEMESHADACFKEFYGKIGDCAAEVKVDKPKDENMLLNLSCLVSVKKVRALGRCLDEINSRPGFTVRFTGPWPPYSFVV